MLRCLSKWFGSLFCLSFFQKLYYLISHRCVDNHLINSVSFRRCLLVRGHLRWVVLRLYFQFRFLLYCLLMARTYVRFLFYVFFQFLNLNLCLLGNWKRRLDFGCHKPDILVRCFDLLARIQIKVCCGRELFSRSLTYTLHSTYICIHALYIWLTLQKQLVLGIHTLRSFFNKFFLLFLSLNSLLSSLEFKIF